MKKYQAAAGIVGTLLLLATSCKAPQAPVFGRLENLEVGKVEMGQAVVTAAIKYYNPNNYPLTLKHAEAGFFIDNKLVGNSVLDTLLQIPKRDSFLLPVSVKLNPRQILSNGLSAILLGEINISVRGFAKLGRNGIFIRLPIDYSGKQKINLDGL